MNGFPNQGQRQGQADGLQRVVSQLHQLAQEADEAGNEARAAELRRAVRAYEAQLVHG